MDNKLEGIIKKVNATIFENKKENEFNIHVTASEARDILSYLLQQKSHVSNGAVRKI